jgi:hypothetical protein
VIPELAAPLRAADRGDIGPEDYRDIRSMADWSSSCAASIAERLAALVTSAA